MSTFTSAESQIEALYVGYFGRAGDPAGMQYWESQLTSGALTLAQIAASFSVQIEAKNAYPFLANPLVDDAAHDNAAAFINTVFQDLFNHGETSVSDPTGFAYWLGRVVGAASNPQAIGQIIEDMISGAPAGSADDLALQNKVTVGDFFSNGLSTNNVAYSATAAALAKTVILATTSTATTVTTEDAAITTFLANAPPPTSNTFTLTAAADLIPGGLLGSNGTNIASGNDVINGFVDDTAGSSDTTLNGGDIITPSGANNIMTVTVSGVGGTANVTNGALLSGIQTFDVRNVSTGAVTLNAALVGGLTAANAYLSPNTVNFISLAANTSVGIVGNGTVLTGNVGAFYLNSATAATLNVQGGTVATPGLANVTIDGTSNAALLASVTINSTGANNALNNISLGTIFPAASILTTVTINPTTNLTVGGLFLDNSMTTLNFTGTGNATFTGSAPQSISDASALGLAINDSNTGAVGIGILGTSTASLSGTNSGSGAFDIAVLHDSSALSETWTNSGTGTMQIGGANSTLDAALTLNGAVTYVGNDTGNVAIVVSGATDNANVSLALAQTTTGAHVTLGNGNDNFIGAETTGNVVITVGNGNDLISVAAQTSGVLTAKVGIGLDTITLATTHTAADSITFVGADGGSTTVLPIITATHVDSSNAVATVDVLNFSNNAQSTTVAFIGGGPHSAAAGLALAQATTAAGYDVWVDGATATSHTFIYENTGTAATSELVELVGIANTGSIGTTATTLHSITIG
jgi:hypothetical protein